MANERFYSIRQEAGSREADVAIFGDIVAYRWDESDTSAWSFRRELQEIDADVIRVHIDSYGGSVSEGWAIYNTLREHPARIETYADGFVASAALYPYLAGEMRQASPVAAFYLHPVMTAAAGYAEDLEKAADEIRKLTEIGVQAFVERTGMSADEVRTLMDAETWLSPDEALEKGIVTKLVREKAAGGAAQSARASVVAAVFAAQKARTEEPKPEEPAKEATKEAEKTETKAENSLLKKFSAFYAQK